MHNCSGWGHGGEKNSGVLGGEEWQKKTRLSISEGVRCRGVCGGCYSALPPTGGSEGSEADVMGGSAV